MTIKLKLNAAAQTNESVAGWQARTYSLTTAARGVDQAPVPLDLAADDVLELELENGTRLLVAAEDAERYLGGGVGRGEGGPGQGQGGQENPWETVQGVLRKRRGESATPCPGIALNSCY